jgi:two-component system, chemotaxis family, sensor kinase CheA
LETSDYKDLFLNEARDYISTLNNALVVLEKDPAQGEAIREIFRAAHTLKGMSATMGYDPMARLCHQMESVLDPIRSGAKPLTSRLVDALFVCLDQLEKWLRILTSQDFIEEERLQSALDLLGKATGDDTVVVDLQASAETTGSKDNLALSESESEVISQARMNGFSVYRVMVELHPDCVFKEVRSFMILKNINELGEIIKTHPAPEAIEKGQIDRTFYLVLVTDAPIGKVREAITGIGELAAVNVEPFVTTARPVRAEQKAAGAKFEPVKVPANLVAAEEKSFALPTIRVNTSKLDKLMALVQELVISKIRFEQVTHSRGLKELLDPLSQLHHITDELQDEIMKVRLIPAKQIFDRFPRMVRDLAKSLQKQVNLEMDGAEVELDRTILEEISEPLMHLLRNAIDHGIETPDQRIKEGKEAFGTIRLQAKRDRSYVVVSVSDDGKGIDADAIRQRSVAKGLISAEDAGKLTDEEALRLIATPGFSTVDNATEVSGRGVGMDVAKTKVENIGGTFRIQSRKALGTTFILKFPLTLAIIKSLLVKCNGEIFAMPVANVVENVDVYSYDKRRIQQQDAIVLREEVIPVYSLQDLLEMEPPPVPEVPIEYENMLIVEVGESRVAINVDEIIGQQEIAIKPLDKLLKGIRGFSGATILGSGKIALILDINGLIEDLKDKRFQVEHPLMEKDDAHASQPR